MDPLSALLAFLWAIVRHWVPIVTSIGVLPLIEQVYKRASGKDLPFDIHFRWIIVGGALLAIFLAWSDEYTEKLSLIHSEANFKASEQTTKMLSDSLARAEKQDIDLRMANNELRRDKDELQRKLEDAQKALRVQKENSDDKTNRRLIREQLAKFQQATKSFEKELLKDSMKVPNALQSTMLSWEKMVSTFLNKKLDSSFVARFDRGMPSHSFPNTINSWSTDWSTWWSWLDGKNVVLGSFMQELGDSERL